MTLQRKTPIRRTGGLKRTPMKRENTERAAKRRAEAFGEQAEACRLLPCVACWATDDRLGAWEFVMSDALHPDRVCLVFGNSDPHHEPTRAAGGKDKDTVPLCRAHHDERHRIGRAAFEAKHGVDLRAVAKAIHDELTAQSAVQGMETGK